VVVDPALYRPAEIHELRGDASKARRELGWEPSVGFRELVRMMVEADLEDLSSSTTERRKGADHRTSELRMEARKSLP
jgi:GDPmannose 4,6-dehydratase